MTPLTTEAAILAYLGREGETTRRIIVGFTPDSAKAIMLTDLVLAGLVLKRTREPETEPYYRLSAKGSRLLAKHRAAVAAAYGLEG